MAEGTLRLDTRPEVADDTRSPSSFAAPAVILPPIVEPYHRVTREDYDAVYRVAEEVVQECENLKHDIHRLMDTCIMETNRADAAERQLVTAQEQRGTLLVTFSGPNDSRRCYAPGKRCLGCDHHFGKADKCRYAPQITAGQGKVSPDSDFHILKNGLSDQAENPALAVTLPEEPYPHCPAAFINAIADEGTKVEAVQWLQKTWNECCALRRVAEEAVRRASNLKSELNRANHRIAVILKRAESAERQLAELRKHLTGIEFASGGDCAAKEKDEKYLARGL